MARKIGFVGLGLMGHPMARNPLGAGYEIVAYNRSPEKSDELVSKVSKVSKGAERAADVRELARACDVIITMLPGPPEAREVLAAPGKVTRTKPLLKGLGWTAVRV